MLHGDFETRGTVELSGQKSVGVYNYLRHPETEPLFFNWAVDDGEVTTWRIWENEPIPVILRERLEDPNEPIDAFNSTFERYCFQFKLDITLPPERFQDPQASARYLSLPGDLEDVSTILGLPKDYAKDKRGKTLIDLFCKPHQLKKKRGEAAIWQFSDWNTHPVEWEEFIEYGRQDVVAEREVLRREGLLGVWPLPPLERRIWVFDQKVNDRGLPVDRDFITKAYALAQREKREKIDLNNEKTGLDNSNSNTQMLEWVLERGYKGLDPEVSPGDPEYPKYSLNKDVVKSEMKNNPALTPLCREVLEIRKTTSSTSYKKMSAMLQRLSPDDRIHNLFLYMGSSRCGRWSSTGIQFHNFARPTEFFEDTENVDQARALIYAMDYDGIKQKYADPVTGEGSVLLTVKSLIRTAFVAARGDRFNVSDLNAIETRVGAWVAGCHSLLNGFRNIKDFDPYMDFAMKMTQIPYEILMRDKKSKDPAVRAKAKHHRQIAKPGVLGCFGADTRVLTNRGWVKIVDVCQDDLVFDGIEWVSHGGVIDKGVREVIQLNGVNVTPEHEVLVGNNDWRTAWDVSQNFRLEKQAIGLASGLLSTVSILNKDTTMSAFVQDVEDNKLCLNKILRGEKPSVVTNVKKSECEKSETAFINSSTNTPEKSSIGWQTDTTQSYPAAEGRVVPDIATVVGVFLLHLLPFTTLWSMFLPSRTPLIQSINSIEKITTETTKKEISGSLLRRSIIEIKKAIVSLNTKVRNTALRIFGKSLPLNTEMSGMSLVQSEKDSQESKLLPDKRVVVVRTYDILNSGSRHRFMIETSKGPMLVHNCIYRMSAATLLDYAEKMGVMMALREAELVVKIFRQAYKEIVDMWTTLEVAVADVLNGERTIREVGPNGCIKIDKFTFDCGGTLRTILRIKLPSGRYIHYMDAAMAMTKMPWKDRETGEDVYRMAFNYASQDQTTKQWTLVSSHGGKIFENIVQGMARDVLAVKLLEIDEWGLPVVGHVHDEGITENEDDPFNPGLNEMNLIMSRPIDWAPGLPLASDGFEGHYYHK